MTKDKKFMISIFDGIYTRIYTTEALDITIAEKKAMALHTYNGYNIIKIQAKEV